MRLVGCVHLERVAPAGYIAICRSRVQVEDESTMIRSLSNPLHEAGSDSWALAGVLALWAGMTMVALGVVAFYGYDLPFSEDWHMVRLLVGREPNLFQWLWAQNHEHRIPLPKALYLLLLKVSGGDFRTGMFANVLLLA